MSRFESAGVGRCLRVGASAALALAVVAGCSRSLRPKPEAGAQAAASRATSQPGAAVNTAATDSGAVHATPPAQGRGVAVVELFTSEGCSSCPPADRVLSALASRATAQSLPVYVLSFHVDYWNYLGWRDRFSTSAYSDRQRGYASINPNGDTYTPQAVINGASECLGSDASQLDAYVAAALQHPPRTRVELEAHRTARGIDFSYRVSGDIAGRVLNLALLEPRAESAVRSGENAGERLSHVNVVRAFISRALASGSAGSGSFEPSADFAAHRVGVVAYAEGATQRDVSGAAALELD